MYITFLIISISAKNVEEKYINAPKDNANIAITSHIHLRFVLLVLFFILLPPYSTIFSLVFLLYSHFWLHLYYTTFYVKMQNFDVHSSLVHKHTCKILYKYIFYTFKTSCSHKKFPIISSIIGNFFNKLANN